MTDFNMVSIAGRAYITPFFTNSAGQETGIQSQFLYVYDGSTCRKAAGVAPTNGSDLPFVAFNSQVDGSFDKGVHVLAVAFRVGGIDGVLGPEVFPVVNAPGGKEIQLVNIPIRSGGAQERIIVSTRAIDPKDYIANQASYTYYEVLRIADNTTANLAVSITDASLTTVYVPGATAAPVTDAILAANSATAGFNDFGLHIFAVVAETDTGYLTAPGPEFFAVLSTIDIKKRIDLSKVPLGPATITTKRHIVATKVINDYNGDQAGFQFFFVPNGTINNNSTTTVSISFYDSDLLEDASHLIDNYAEIPAGVGLTTYHGRLVLTTTFADISIALVSHPGEPEAIDQVDGIIIAPLDGNPLTNCQEFRDILYLFKQTRTIGYADNNDVPSTWTPFVIDEGVGAPVHGIGTVLNSGGVNVDFLLIADYSGIFLFNGAYSRPELSYKIKDFWMALNRSEFREIELVNDSLSQILYCVLPDATILIGNYDDGLDAKGIKWGIWSFDIPITTVDIYQTNTIIVGGTVNASNYSGIYLVTDGKTDDTLYNLSGTLTDFKIPDPLIRTALINESGVARGNESSENINHFTGFKVRVNGSGNLIPRLMSLDDASTLVLTSLIMSSAPGLEPFRLANFQTQRARLELKTSVIDETVKINRIILYAKEVFAEFPA